MKNNNIFYNPITNVLENSVEIFRNLIEGCNKESSLVFEKYIPALEENPIFKNNYKNLEILTLKKIKKLMEKLIPEIKNAILEMDNTLSGQIEVFNIIEKTMIIFIKRCKE